MSSIASAMSGEYYEEVMEFLIEQNMVDTQAGQQALESIQVIILFPSFLFLSMFAFLIFSFPFTLNI
jgi:hypothetical protein